MEESEAEEILRLGRENPLSDDEAVRLLTTVIICLLEGAGRRGRPIDGLEGDPKTLAEQMVQQRKFPSPGV